MRVPPVAPVGVPDIPVLADACLFSEELGCQFDIVLPLADLHGKARRRMPRDVAMISPDTWIIGLEGDGDVALAGQKHGITARRVVVVEGAIRQVIGVEFSVFLRQHDVIVTVKMDRMSQGDESSVFCFLVVAYC